MDKKRIRMIGIAGIVVVVLVVSIGVISSITRKSGNEKTNAGNQEVYTDEKDEVLGKDETKSDSESKVQDEQKTEATDIRDWFREETDEEGDMFPYQIPNTSLVIRAVKSYNGVFIEDGSDMDVSGISAIIVDNKGNEYIEYAKITLKCDGTDLVYEVKTLEPGATMVVQESTAAKYVDGEYGECTAQVATMDGLEMSEESVKITTTETGAIKVENISGADIPCVRIFYKFYMADVKVSVGGITYTSKITELKAGESRVITPSHYDADASRVMMVRTYDTY